MPSGPAPRQVWSSADSQHRSVCPGWIRTGDRARQGGDVGGEGAGVGDIFQGQLVKPAAEMSEGGKAVEEACGEGVAGADGVNGHDRRCWDGDACAVQGYKGSASAERNDDEACAGGMPGVASLFEAGIRGEVSAVLLTEAEDVGGGAPEGQAFAVDGRRYEQGADIGVDGHRGMLACLGEMVLDPAGARLTH